MKRTSATVLFACGLAFAATFLGAEETAGGRSKTDLQTAYVEYLKGRQWSPEIDADGDVRFRRSGRTYYIQIDPKEPEFFRILLPVNAVENETDKARSLIAADFVNTKTKVVKMVHMSGFAWVTVEVPLPAAGAFRAITDRCLAAMDSGLESYAQKLREN